MTRCRKYVRKSKQRVQTPPSKAYAMPVESTGYTTATQKRAMSNIVAIAADNLPRNEALDAAFEELQKLCPCAAISLSIYDPVTRNHRSILSQGYSKKNLDYLDNSYLLVDPAYQSIKRSGKAFFNWESTDFDYTKTGSARNFWLPSGFRGGSSNYLTSRKNLYVGNLHISTDHPRYPSIETLQIIDELSPILSVLLDTWQEPRAFISDLQPGECAFFIDMAGNVHGLAGCQRCKMFDLHEKAKSAVAAGGKNQGLGVLSQKIPESCWYACDDAVHLVNFRNCNKGILVIHKTSKFPKGLTRRQAEVCSLLSLGMTSHQVGDVLNLSTRTIDSHVENIFEKIGASNRIELVYFSITEGLVNLCDFINFARGRSVTGNSLLATEVPRNG